MAQPSTQNLYEVLEIAPDALQDEIHRAFHKAKMTYSANSSALYSMFTPDEASQLLKLIDEAYAILSDSNKRKAYDRQLFQTKAQKQASPKSESAQVPDPTQETLKVAPKSKDAGRSRLSHYVINSEFEAEIAKQTVFDGSFLKKIRIYKNITIDQLTEYTRIGRHYVNAVEGNEYHLLPAPVFIRGFVCQVAKALSLDEKKVADSYMALYKQTRG